VFIARHILESTVFCLLLSGLACCLRKSATARYAVWLVGIAKFAIPTVLLAGTGAKFALFWPANSWLSTLANRISALFVVFWGLLPLKVDREILAIWMGGMLVMAALWIMRLNRSRCLLSPATNEERTALSEACEQLGFQGNVKLCVSGIQLEPTLHGFWQSTISVPRGLYNNLSSAEFRAVLLHELAHARRLDNLASAFVHCLVCLFWFHPLLWFVERRLNVDRERACDELVVACGAKPETYAAGILKVCKFHLFDKPLAASPGLSSITGADLNRRLELILNYQLSARLIYFPRVLLACVVILMTIVPIAGGYCEQCVSNGQGFAISSPVIPTKDQSK
jgi:beta-lactamase regulating signal transducer with metallopeptidase domain